MPTITRLELRLGAIAGLVAAVFMWLAFFARGGIAGATHTTTFKSLFVLGLQLVIFAAAGFAAHRRGLPRPAGVHSGLVAGVVSAICADYPLATLMLLSHRYMHWIQYTPSHSNGHHLYLPPAPVTVLLALVGAVVAGAALGASVGSIGAAVAGEGREPEQAA